MARQPRTWRGDAVLVSAEIYAAAGGSTHHRQVDVFVRAPVKADAFAACESVGIRLGSRNLCLDRESVPAAHLDYVDLLDEHPLVFISAVKDRPIIRLYPDGSPPEVVAHWRYDGALRNGRGLYIERVTS